MVVIPYMEGLSQKARRIFKKHGVATSMKPNTTLLKFFVHPKDKRDLPSTTEWNTMQKLEVRLYTALPWQKK